MTFVHGHLAVVSVNGTDISAYTKKCDIDRDADSHDTTGFGKSSHVYAGGLKDGKVQLEGTYDSSASLSPRAVIEAVLGTVVTLIYKPEGAGSGKPIKTVSVLVKKYKESTEVADMIKWTSELTCSDDVVVTTG